MCASIWIDSIDLIGVGSEAWQNMQDIIRLTKKFSQSYQLRWNAKH